MAAQEVLTLSQIVRDVTLITNSKKLKAENSLVKELIRKGVQIMEGYKVEAIERGELTNDTGKSFITDGIFIALGVEPSALKVEKIGVKTHRQGGILVDSRQQTNVEDGYNVSGYLTGREWQPLATVKSPEDLKEAISAVNGAYENIKGK